MSVSGIPRGARAFGEHPPVPGRPLRVLIADDSALMRQVIRRILESDPELQVVDTARDGRDALEKIERWQPDVVTMDVEMPGLDGLSALGLVMERSPRPVVMVSSLTAAGTEATVRALALGAVDFVTKPSGLGGAGFAAIADQLIEKIKQAARARVRRPLRSPPSPPPPAVEARALSARRLLVIGSSTGGPRALAELFAHLPGDLDCAVLVVQHLPAGFTRSLAERLDHASSLAVAEAQHRDLLVTGRALLAPGDYHLIVTERRVQLEQSPRRHGVRPAVDATLESAARHFGSAVCAVVLTGMGCDGTEGARAVKEAGGVVLAEAESSCVVYGMPRSVIEAGLADDVVPLERMAEAVARHVRGLPEVQRGVGRAG